MIQGKQFEARVRACRDAEEGGRSSGNGWVVSVHSSTIPAGIHSDSPAVRTTETRLQPVRSRDWRIPSRFALPMTPVVTNVVLPIVAVLSARRRQEGDGCECGCLRRGTGIGPVFLESLNLTTHAASAAPNCTHTHTRMHALILAPG